MGGVRNPNNMNKGKMGNTFLPYDENYSEDAVTLTTGKDVGTTDGATDGVKLPKIDSSALQGKAEVQSKTGLATPSGYDATRTLNSQINELWRERMSLKEDDETAKRRANALSSVAGLSDGLSALANLIGVSKGASNIDSGNALTPLQEKVESARLERKADIKDINDRLDQKLAEQRAMRMQYAQMEQAQRNADRAFNYGVLRDKKEDERWKQSFEYTKLKDDRDYDLAERKLTADIDLANKQFEEAKRANKAAEAARWSNISLQKQQMRQNLRTNEYPIAISSTEILRPDKADVTNGTIDPIWNMLTLEEKALAQSSTSYSLYGSSSSISLDDKVGAIAAAAANNPEVAKALRKTFGGKGGKKANPMD